jgi:phosphatidylserine/phosphatidylglycerophosphate/cardiolipin synthase-like enzyme
VTATSPEDDPAEDWLLPEHERPRCRGNDTALLVHGSNYFARLRAVIGACGPGDRVFFTDWRGDPDERLADDGPTVQELMCAALRRGVHVRALLWRSHSDRTSFSAQENQHLGAAINEAGGEALLDQRVRRGGSHHQKLVVVRHRDRPADDVAFVGGIDLCHGRRDDENHHGDPQRQPMDRRYGERAPWHDAMLEVRGPAVHEVQATFSERWNDPTPLDHRNPYRRMLQRAAHMPSHAQPLPPPLDPPAPTGPHTVQVLRTYAAKWPRFPFAPKGERSIAHAYTHAFARARRLVYVEDQYLWSGLVAGALARALRSQPKLQAIVVVPRYPDADGALSGPPNRYGQLQAMALLREAGGDRVGIYDIENEAGCPIYVHAKVCVVDDVWMTCGSDNFNRRSWTHDSEITCAVVDGTRDARAPVDPRGDGLGARRLPRDARARLWAEHLGVPSDAPELLDPDAGAELWRARATDLDDWHASGQTGPRPPGRARPHRPDPVSRVDRWWAAPMYRLVFDPDGRPASARIRRAL